LVTTVRITLKTREGKNIFKKPMFLISNIKVKSYLEAKEIYHIYLLRSKIEAVFKFLKDVLGWEEFAQAERQNALHASKGLGIHQKYYCSLFFCG